MVPITKRTKRGLAEAVLLPTTLGGLVALVLTLGQWLGSAA
jgi:hypothetical protein